MFQRDDQWACTSTSARDLPNNVLNLHDLQIEFRMSRHASNAAYSTNHIKIRFAMDVASVPPCWHCTCPRFPLVASAQRSPGGG